MKLPVLFRWFLFCCSLSILQPILGQEKVTVAYGSAFEGSDGNIFGSSDGSGFDGSNKATIALGYFTSGFDVASSVASEDVTSLIESFNVLHSANFSSVAAPGFLGTGGTFDAAGVGETPYMFLAAGITDFADASSATEYGLFTDSGFGIIPDGGSPVPVDWSIARLSYDSVLLGSEKSGGGFGSANAYLTQEISGGGDGGDDQDTTAPIITLIGEPELTIAVGGVH